MKRINLKDLARFSYRVGVMHFGHDDQDLRGVELELLSPAGGLAYIMYGGDVQVPVWLDPGYTQLCFVVAGAFSFVPPSAKLPYGFATEEIHALAYDTEDLEPYLKFAPDEDDALGKQVMALFEGRMKMQKRRERLVADAQARYMREQPVLQERAVQLDQEAEDGVGDTPPEDAGERPDAEPEA